MSKATTAAFAIFGVLCLFGMIVCMAIDGVVPSTGKWRAANLVVDGRHVPAAEFQFADTSRLWIAKMQGDRVQIFWSDPGEIRGNRAEEAAHHLFMDARSHVFHGHAPAAADTD
jgi:hypothetical protein